MPNCSDIIFNRAVIQRNYAKTRAKMLFQLKKVSVCTAFKF